MYRSGIIALAVVAGCAAPRPATTSTASAEAGASKQGTGTASDSGGDGAPRCAADQWCWVHGIPVSALVTGDSGELFAIGEHGWVLQWKRERWRQVSAPTSDALVAGWVGPSSELWVLTEEGQNWVLSSDGWRQHPLSDPLFAFVGTDAEAPLAVSRRGKGTALWRWEGERWQPATEVEDPYCYGGSYLVERGEIVAAGLVCEDGRIVGARVHRYDDGQWRPLGGLIEADVPVELSSARGKLRVDAASLLAWDGGRWTPVKLGEFPQRNAPGMTTVSDGDAFDEVPASTGCVAIERGAGARWCRGNGQIWRERSPGTWAPTIASEFDAPSSADMWGTIPPALWAGKGTLAAWGGSPSEVYRIYDGASPVLQRWSGTRWSTIDDAQALGLDGSGEEVWALTKNGILHGDGDALERLSFPAGVGASDVRHVRAAGKGTGWIDTANALWRFDGGWTSMFAAESGWEVHDFAVLGAEVWVSVTERDKKVPLNRLVHFDGTQWVVLESKEFGGPSALFAGSGQVWRLHDGRAERLTGKRLAFEVPSPSVGVELWVGPDAIWMLGRGGAAWRSTASSPS